MQLKKPLPFFKIQNRSCPPLIAVIDVGTNTIRLLIGYVEHGKVIRIYSDRAVTRLGKDILKTGNLNANSIKKSITFILKLKKLCEEYNVHKTITIGTSALREAKNSKEFLEDVKKIAGLDIEIISGEKEAELTLMGVLGSGVWSLGSGEKNQTSFIVDIGGGSTEWILLNSNKLQVTNNKFKGKHDSQLTKNSKLIMDSIPIGAVKLFETFIKHDPPAPEELLEMRNYIFEEFSQTFKKNSLKDYLHYLLFTNHYSLSLIVTGGTVTTIAAIDMNMDEYDGDRIHIHKISLSTLKTIYKRLITLPHDKRSKIKGLEPERADIIISGTLILLTLMEALKIDEITVSDYGLLEGSLISYHMSRIQ